MVKENSRLRRFNKGLNYIISSYIAFMNDIFRDDVLSEAVAGHFAMRVQLSELIEMERDRDCFLWRLRTDLLRVHRQKIYELDNLLRY